MADIRAFAGIRYNTVRYGTELSTLVCPPYDVISPSQQDSLYARHPANFVRLELSRVEPGADPEARYQQAGQLFRQWRQDATLVAEAAPAFYAYEHRFVLNGGPSVRRGLVAAMRLEPWDRRVVRPHERTLSGPKRDRLNLMHACRANFSPIWGLYEDPDAATARVWRTIDGRPPDAEAYDADDVRHRLWVISDRAAIQGLEASLAEQPVYIADGHHRYETALHYRAELRDRAGGLADDAAANFVLAYLVESADPGLMVLGTHRLVQFPQPVDQPAVLASLARWFDLESASDDPDMLLAAVEAADGAAFGVWAPGLGVSVLARRADPDGVPMELAGDHSAAWRRLDLASLHTLVIDQLFPQGTSALSEAGLLSYSRTVAEVKSAVSSGRADIGFLVRHTPASQVMAVADAGDLMPEKSTYFYPKPVSGLVVAALEGDVRRTV